MFAGVGFDFRRGAFQRVARLLQPQLGIPEFQVFVNVVQKGEHGLVFLHGGMFAEPIKLTIQFAGRDERLEIIGTSAWLDEIASLAGVRRGVFSSGLHLHPFSRRRSADFRLRLCSGPADRPADRPPRVLFRAGDRVSLLRAATVFLLAHVRPGRDCAVAGARILDRAVHGDCLRQHPALGEGRGDVAGSDCLDRAGIFPQRTLLPEIFVAEHRVCPAGAV